MIHQRLYINIDHIATIRQARRGTARTPWRAPSSASAPAPTASPPTFAKTADTYRTTTSPDSPHR